MRDPGAGVALETGFKRGERWPEVRRAHLKRQPHCIACKTYDLGFWESIFRRFRSTVVHHIYPFHLCRALDRADLEYDSRNLVTLCYDHHWVLGHFADWGTYNPHVKHLALRFYARPIRDVMADAEWARFRDERRMDIRFLTADELSQLRIRLDDKFPR